MVSNLSPKEHHQQVIGHLSPHLQIKENDEYTKGLLSCVQKK